jgi:hypothetical protein
MILRRLFALCLCAAVGGCGGQQPLSLSHEASGQAKWTFMVFLNASNNLNGFALPDIDEMERAAQNADINIIVQLKATGAAAPYAGTNRIKVQPNTASGVTSPIVAKLGMGVDMGSPQTLNSFVNWCRAKYPAERYALVIWNHGNGWRESSGQTRGVSYDSEMGSSISTTELPGAIPGKLDILAFDASLMQMVEVAYEARSKASYIIGSEESPPGAGYPYHRLLAKFRDQPSATTAVLSRAFVTAMLSEPGYSESRITQSVVDTAKLGTLAEKVGKLGTALIANRSAVVSQVRKARSEAQPYGDNGVRFYRDAASLFSTLQSGTPAAVAASAKEAEQAVAAAVLWNGRNSNSPGSRGLSIEFAAGPVFAASAPQYARLAFAKATGWDKWLKVAP